MLKMEFLKRKHFSSWITTFVLLAGFLDVCSGLQGVPTWICLGLKSPFIEFSNELEVLANNSVPLNITKDEQALMHQEGLRKLGTFIKPVDLRDSSTGFVKADLTKKVPSKAPGTQVLRRLHPIQEEMDQKQIILLDEDTDENGLPASLTDEDRKFIVPMALKNASPDPRLSVAATTQRTTTTTQAPTTTRRMSTPPTPEFASNIDDLKKHILFLQNLTKHDSSFQSKFVVFPSLQKDKQKQSSSTTTTTVRPFFQYSAPVVFPTPKVPIRSSSAGQPFGGYYHNEDDEEDEEHSMSVFLSPSGESSARDKITIVPQVLLLNDQMATSGKNQAAKDSAQHTNGSAGEISYDSSTVSTVSSSLKPILSASSKRPTKRPVCLRNPDSPKCIRQRKREELQRQRDRELLLLEQRAYLPPRAEPLQTINNTKRFAVSIEIPDSLKFPVNESDSFSTPEAVLEGANLQVLSRQTRSHHRRRNIGGGLQGRRKSSSDKFVSKYGASYYERDAVLITGGRDFLISNMEQFELMQNTSTPSPTVAAYSEPIDLNPDNCYLVDGMSYGQKKQCVLHTSIMPAISRGARACIQECQYQFKNRRWNCSTIEDNTVFGPMSGLGSPEMAFIHALAAATVTSFIARACRDGQLASCGCSRGSRPKQLHDDWTWGGCGDNLEFAYKFATDFIDIREKETKRGTRGAGNPERRRGRLQQRRNQQKLPSMQADDARAVSTSVVEVQTSRRVDSPNANGTMLVATATTMRATLERSKNATARQQQKSDGSQSDNNQERNSNKTVSTDDNNHHNYSNNNGTNVRMGNGNSNNNKDSNGTDSGTILTSRPTSSNTAANRMSAPVSVAPPKQEDYSEEEDARRIKPEDLLELQERITKEILNSKLQEKEMLELQEKINREILSSKVFNMEANSSGKRKRRRKNQRAVDGVDVSHDRGYSANMEGASASASAASIAGVGIGAAGGKWRNGISAKARSLMNLHNNEAGRRAVIKKTRITCKCHGVSGSCSLITCWQQLSSIREIGDYLREKYEEATEVKLNKRGRLQVKDPQFKVPTAHDLVFLDESPDWCRNSRQLQWPGTHGRICNKTSSGLDGCGILCCGRGYNTKNIVVRERCNCKFHWCCQVKCDVCVKVLEEHTCK